MYSYTFDTETGGILLNSTPTVFSKEPRPVYAAELDLLGFDKYWNYAKQNDVPYMWAESVNYYYYGKLVARLKGGDLYHAPEIILATDENGNIVTPVPDGSYLKPIDMAKMISKNRDIMDIIEGTTIKKIVKVYEKNVDKLDLFHVAFSGGKDSAVLLDLVKKALPKKSFIVIFGDTGMEFPDTYQVVEETKRKCDEEDIPFYIAQSHFKPEDSWKMFGPPARVLRWCCSVHKSTPQTIKMREIAGKNDYIGLDFVGVRKEESTARSEYEYENYGKKQKGQYSHNSILEWTSAEIWLYLYIHNLSINEAYKKGNSRAGCLFCPMGGNRGDYVQYKCYTKEIDKYISMIKEMNARNKGNEKALDSYIYAGGWNARKNGRDLTINETKYKEKREDSKLIIETFNKTDDWKEWIKTLGTIPFDYSLEEKEDGVKVEIFEREIKKYPLLTKRFRQVFKKSAYCVGCRVCETNCKNGCISFENGLKITNCLHCGQCFEIDDACLAYHSLKTKDGDGIMREKSLNAFANHAPKKEWIRSFFELGADYWELNDLNKQNQEPKMKRFLKETGLIDDKCKLTFWYDYSQKNGWESNTLWAVMAINFLDNPQFDWYVKNMDIGVEYERDRISELLMFNDVKKDDAVSIIGSYKRFCELPFGYRLNFGYVIEKGKSIVALSRSKCMIDDGRVILYALYKFSEKCSSIKEFTLAWLMNESVERDGVSPTRLFGLDYDEMKSKLMGLSDKYPDFINATFTNDLDKISLTNKTSQDVLTLFKED